MEAEIYALYTTRDGRVRYVGESVDRLARFKLHLRSAEIDCSLGRWFHQEWRDGYLVRYALLDVCDFDARHAVETNWIWRFPTFDLLNRRKKRRWGPAVGTPPRIAEIDSYMHRYTNVVGFPGVQYDQQTGYYRVLIYNPGNGRWVYWLEGDELPGGSEPIWFSDLAQASDAKENKEHPNRAVMEARRQEDIIVSGAHYEERVRTEQGGYDYWSD